MMTALNRYRIAGLLAGIVVGIAPFVVLFLISPELAAEEPTSKVSHPAAQAATNDITIPINLAYAALAAISGVAAVYVQAMKTLWARLEAKDLANDKEVDAVRTEYAGYRQEDRKMFQAELDKARADLAHERTARLEETRRDSQEKQELLREVMTTAQGMTKALESANESRRKQG